MNDILFGDFERFIHNKLCDARKSVKVAVAWLNLNIYGQIFEHLLNKGISVEIILNEDFKNNNLNTKMYIDRLVNQGAFIKFIKMPSPTQYMHHKFCLIDNSIALIGSYNWTKSAANNFENLMYIEDEFIVTKLKKEFKRLKKISNTEIHKLLKFEKCDYCKVKLINIISLNVDMDEYHRTEYTLYSVCECGKQDLYTDYLDSGFYLELNSIGEKYFYDMDTSNLTELESLKAWYDHEVKTLMEKWPINIMEKTIHAIGIRKYQVTDRHGGGEWVTKIIWKNRFVEKFVNASYDLD